MSAALMTVSARWYAARAADGIPLTAALPTAASGSPCTPGASWARVDRLAGASMASSGTVLPSGSVPSALALAGADPPSEVAMLTLQAAESRASGTRVAARLEAAEPHIRHRGSLLLHLPGSVHRALPSPAGTPPTRVGTHGLRASIPTVTWVTPETDVRSRYVRYGGGAGRCGGSPPVGDNDPVTTSDRRTTASEALFDAGPRGDPRGRQLAGPGVQRRRRHTPVHPLGPRRVADRRRRQRVRRPGLLVGRDAARARPPRGPGGGRRRGGARHVLRHPDRARGRARRGDRRTHAHRPGPVRLLGHRGHHVRHPAGPRRHRSRRGGEVRRLLPRPRRLAAGRGGLGAGHLRRCPARPASRRRPRR